MNDEFDRDALIEEVAGAFRPRSTDQLAYLPAWHDLDEVGRQEAFARATEQRAFEAALHPDGLSTTALAVLRRIQP